MNTSYGYETLARSAHGRDRPPSQHCPAPPGQDPRFLALPEGRVPEPLPGDLHPPLGLTQGVRLPARPSHRAATGTSGEPGTVQAETVPGSPLPEATRER